MDKSTDDNSLIVAALAGRRPDAIGANDVRFPLTNVNTVKEKIKQLFTEHKFTHLVCAAACGADLIALEVATDLTIACHIILPFEPPAFRVASVTDRPGDWGELYDRLIDAAKNAKRLHLLGYSPDDVDAFSKTTKAIINYAKKLATERAAFGVVVWEGQSRGADDATQEFATLSHEQGLHIVEVLTI